MPSALRVILWLFQRCFFQPRIVMMMPTLSSLTVQLRQQGWHHDNILTIVAIAVPGTWERLKCKLLTQ